MTQEPTHYPTDTDELQAPVAENLQNALLALLDEYGQDDLYDDLNEVEVPVEMTGTFADHGVMTYNQGLVVRTKDGSEFQLTIVQSR